MTTPPSTSTFPNDLFDFAWIPPKTADALASRGFDQRLQDLASRAQPEAWGTDPAHPLAILGNYLRYTYKRVAHEGKVAESIDSGGTSVAGFNTGLFTPNYEAIYAFFEANRNPGKQPWIFRDFIVESERRASLFASRPKPARYFDRPGDLIYDPDLELIPNLDHILDDNVERYPADLQAKTHRRRMILQGAVTEAGKRAQMNYKVAVPQFYFGYDGAGSGHMQLLLPLCFEDPKRADLALVVERDKNAYRAFTVLPLDWAYKNARLIARPDVEWLPTSGAGPKP